MGCGLGGKAVNTERLKEASDAAREHYNKLNAPASAAYEKYKEASAAYKEAVMYEKAKRQVMRELIRTAGTEVEP
jgi:hypothetical protein